MRGMTLLPIAAVLILLGAATTRGDAPAADPDKAFLQDAGIATDGPGLLAYFRAHTGSDADLLRMDALARQLGDDDFNAREEASRKLVALGLTALPAVRRLLPSTDPEVTRRVQVCIPLMQRGWQAGVNPAAVRLLLRLRPAHALDVLLGYLPYEADEEAQEEIWFGLDALTKADGKVDERLAAALRDPVPVRRALAAVIVGHRGDTEQRKAVRDLLKDGETAVRMRAAQGLLAAKDTAGLPALVALLEETPVDEAWQAEELLHYAAGEQAPSEVVGAGTAKSRQACRAAWAAWFKENGEKLDLSKIDEEPRRPGLILAWDEGTGHEKLDGRVWVCGCSGKAGWQLKDVLPVCAQLLPGGHLLLSCRAPGEVLPGRPALDAGPYRGINEWDLEGHSVWRSNQGPPFGGWCQRLANGNTFMDQGDRTCEVTHDGKTTYTQAPVLSDEDRSSLLRPVSRPGRLFMLRAKWAPPVLEGIQEFDAQTGRPTRRIDLPEKIRGRFAVVPFPGGRYLISVRSVGQLPKGYLLDAGGRLVELGQFPWPGEGRILHNGNFLVSRGEGHVNWVEERDAAGLVVWESVPEAQGRWDGARCRVCYGLVRLGFDEPRPAGLDLATSIPYRIKLLKDKDANVRYAALGMLREMGPKAAIATPAIIDALDDFDFGARCGVVDILESLNPAALPYLLKAVHDKRPRVRAGVAMALGWYGKSADVVMPVLIEALGDDDPRVRRGATYGLDRMGPDVPGVVSALCRALKDEDRPTLSQPYTEANAKAGDPACTVEGRLMTFSDSSVAQNAAHDLSLFGPKAKEAVPALIATLTTEDTTLRGYAIGALAAIGPEARPAVPQLIRILHSKEGDDPETVLRLRRCAVIALGAIGSSAKEVTEALNEALKDDALRPDVEKALSKIAQSP